MTGDGMYFTNLANTLRHISSDEKAVFLSGCPGSGKTFAALQFCSEHKENLYFSLKNIDDLLALQVFCDVHPEIFGGCLSWQNFFDCLKTYGTKKRLLVFFDHAGERNDKEDFYADLDAFLNEDDGSISVVLLGRPWENVPPSFQKVEITYFSMPQLADEWNLSDQTAAKVYCLTGAIPALISLYDKELPFEENVKAFLRTDSAFYRLAADWMRESFRSPESYNTLLYAMANGYNRIGEIAKFSGFPKNKCDKYIKALMEHGLATKIPGENGHTQYIPANTYLTLWYKILLTAIPNTNGSFREETYQCFMRFLNDKLLADFYRNMCYYWLKENINSNAVAFVDTKNTAYHNIAVDGMQFDFAFRDGRNVYAYFDTVPGEGLTADLWNQIEAVTTKADPFYKNEYYICTVNRVPDSFWKLSKTYDNVHIVSPKMLFATYKKEYNRVAHPRFVPSFVNKR